MGLQWSPGSSGFRGTGIMGGGAGMSKDVEGGGGREAEAGVRGTV